MAPKDASTELFRSSWSLYDAIIEGNFMFHREIQESVSKYLVEASVTPQYSLLDLGCGNAKGLVSVFQLRPPSRYVGVDLSRAALDEAVQQLHWLSGVELLERDMLACAEELVQRNEEFNIVYSAFAMHHLTTSEKAELFLLLYKLLASEGMVMLVDIVGEPNQTRDSNLRNYMKMVESEWGSLSQEQIEQVRDHLTSFDYWETLPCLEQMAIDAGFAQCSQIAQYRQHAVMLFTRN